MSGPAVEMRDAAQTLMTQLDFGNPTRLDLYSLVGQLHRWATAYERNCVTVPGSNVVMLRQPGCVGGHPPRDGAA